MTIERNRITAFLGEVEPQHNLQMRAIQHSPVSLPSTRKQTIWPWPGLILVLLALNMSVVGITLWFAASDASFAVEPEYYRKALDWDRSLAQREHNLALGWRVTIAPGVSGQPVAIRVTDRNGSPIIGARIQMIAFHNAAAHTRLDTILEEIEPGLYRSSETLTRTGSWEIRLEVRARDDRFTSVNAHVVLDAGAVP